MMSKYIDADELRQQRPENLNEENDKRDRAEYAKGWNACNKYWIDILHKMPTADVELVRKWIPCSERLPKYGEVVLCLCQNNGITVSCITYEKEKPREIARFGQHYVKAWMPLSVLPKMDGR